MRCKYVRVLVCAALSVCCVFGLAAGAAPALAASSVSDQTLDVFASTSVPAETVAVSASDPAVVSDSGVVLSDGTSEFSDLAYIDVSSSLGDIRLYLAYGVELGILQERDGLLYNVSNSTVYLYCPQYPSYTFSASRFSPVMYRVDGYSSTTLSDVSVSFSSGTLDSCFEYIVIFGIILIVLTLIWRGKK